MAQVNSSPGVNAVFSTAAVTAQLTTQTNPAAGVEPGNQVAVNTIVPYSQAEPGLIRDKNINKDRS